jgi:putative membrane protein
MRSYQTLSVVAGILGLLIVFIVYAIAGSLSIFMESFGNEELEGKDQIFLQVGVSAFLYIIAIIIPFVIKSSKISGYVLIGLALSTIISAGGFGIIGFAILIAAGIAALRWKEKTNGNSAIEVLKERFAKGEITKAEFDQMKEDLK